MKFLKFFLIPFEYLYFVITSIRNFLYDKNLLKVYKFDDKKIISVGNVSIGGSGKTPLVIYIVNYLKEKGVKVGVVTRGYKSKIKEKSYIIKNGDAANFVGDEPYMIFKSTNVPVCISKKRKNGVQALGKSADVIVLDDAMQHRAIFRDINILCIDVGSEKSRKQFLSNRLLPYGFLREKIQSVLKRTDICMLNYRTQYIQSNNELDMVRKKIGDIPAFECFIEHIEIINKNGDICPKNKDIIVFCAISKPQNFIYSLEKEGYKILEKYLFLDHRNFNEKFLKKMFFKADKANLPCVCTQKDFVKLPTYWQERCFFAKINIRVLQEDKFFNYILKELKK